MSLRNRAQDAPHRDLLIYILSLGGGGAERAMIELGGRLRKNGRRVGIVCNTSDGAYTKALSDSGVDVIELGTGVSIRDSLTSIPNLVRVIRQHRPRTILSTLTRCNLTASAVCPTLFPHTRLVLRQAANIAPARGAKIIGPAAQLLFRRADHIVAVSDSTAADLLRYGVPAHKVSTIPNSVDHAQLRAAAHSELPPPLAWIANKAALVAVGALSQQKAFDVLLHAFARLDPDLELVILGEGPNRAELEALASRLGIRERVHMPGFISNPFPVVAKASLFVLPSRWEGMPNVLLQAMSLGVPCVATDAPGGSAEVLEYGAAGNLAPPDDPAALAVAMKQTLQHPRDKKASAKWAEKFGHAGTLVKYERVLFPEDFAAAAS